MDASAISQFVSQTLPLLQPYLPLIAGKAAEKLGTELPSSIGKLWGAIREKFAPKPAAKEAADDLLKDPENTDVQAAFRVQLKKALEEDAAFRASLQGLLLEAAMQTGEITILGDDNININGSSNITAGRGAVINFGDVEGDINTSNQPARRRK